MSRSPARRGLPLAQVDFHWPDRMLVVEVDGGHHTRRPTARDDERRDRVLVAAGWTVLRFTDRDVYERPGTVRAALTPYGLSLTPSRAA